MSRRDGVRFGTIAWGCAALAVALGGCCPQVRFTIPTDGATNVPVRMDIRAKFNKEMCPASITTETFTLKQGDTLVPATVKYNAETQIAILSPTEPLQHSTVYTAAIGANVEKNIAKCDDCSWPLVLVPVVIGAIAHIFSDDKLVEHEWTFTTSEEKYLILYAGLPPAGGTIDGPRGVAEGESPEFNVTVNPGYTLGPITTTNGTISGTGPYTLSDVTGNAVVTAVFIPDLYKLSYVVQPKKTGKVTGPLTVITGGEATLNVTPSDGWELESLTATSGTISGTGPYTLSGVMADATITATFRQISYAVTYVPNPAEGGSVTGADTINAGGAIEVTVAANAGWNVTSVTTSNGVITASPPYMLSNVTGPVTVTANFLNSSTTK